MIWVALLLLAAAAVAPLCLALRPQTWTRGRRDAALTLHRAQLAEIDRDLADGRIAAAEHEIARLEIQRRLLAAGSSVDAQPQRSGRGTIVAAMVVVPAAALGLYLLGGTPGMPAAPLAARIAATQQRAQETNQLIAELRGRLALMTPRSETARQGYVLVGNAEASRGNLPGAMEAWQSALTTRFDATLAAETAEAMTEINGHATPEAAELFRQALAAAPADAPWRATAERRIHEADAQR